MELSILNLLHSLLDDDHGVSEEGWEYLNLLILKIFGPNVPTSISTLLDEVLAVDGRFYLPK